jgi:hypothetical protein
VETDLVAAIKSLIKANKTPQEGSRDVVVVSASVGMSKDSAKRAPASPPKHGL